MFSAVKDLLLAVLDDGQEMRPGDFEDKLMGGCDIVGVMLLRGPRWNSSPFFYALSELVRDGVIEFRRDEEGIYWYRRTSTTEHEK